MQRDGLESSENASDDEMLVMLNQAKGHMERNVASQKANVARMSSARRCDLSPISIMGIEF